MILMRRGASDKEFDDDFDEKSQVDVAPWCYKWIDVLYLLVG